MKMLKDLKKLIVDLRDWYLVHVKWCKYRFGKNFHAGRNVVLWAKNDIVIGDNCYIGRNSQIEANMIIGNNVIIANNVAFVGRYDHHFQQVGTPIRFASQIRDSHYDWKGLNERIVLEDDVWVGYGSIVLSGVTIKTGAIIAAGSVVTKNVDSCTVYGGNPAKKISDRFENKEDMDNHMKLINKV